jgi:hypothetical protein
VLALRPGWTSRRLVLDAGRMRPLRVVTVPLVVFVGSRLRVDSGSQRPPDQRGCRLMHHHLDKLAGVRTHAEVDAEIVSENRAIANIEEAIDNYIPPRCSFCTATALDWCSLCERPMCESDAIADGICIECDAEVLS